MEFKIYKDLEAYTKKVKKFLEQEEVVNNLPLGILKNLAKPKEAQTQLYDDEPLLALVEDEKEPILILLMTPPYNLYVYGVGNKLEEASHYAIDQLIANKVNLPGVVGPKDVADLFTNIWVKKTGVTPQIGMDQRIYQLKEVKIEQKTTGLLRPAEKADISLLTDWIHEFTKVTLGALPNDECVRRANKMVEQGTAYVWQVGDEVVSMVSKTRPTENGITVSFVFTPPNHQRNGYATASVAAFSQLLLDEGYKYCTLYTDLANPTSNSIYMKIGYEPIRDSIMYEFV